MHHALWTGPELKLEYAAFHMGEMRRAVEQRPPDNYQVAQMAAGAIIDNSWQTRFYAHFDAFLLAARSIPEVIQCCFGIDQRPPPPIKKWLDTLDPAEKKRRHDFTDQFAPAYKHFRDNFPLSNTRHTIEHRTGVAPIEVIISSFYGVTYVGGPTSRLPLAETRDLPDPAMQPMLKPTPLPQPSWQDFKIDGRRLFETVEEYLAAAHKLVSDARGISQLVHGTNSVTAPPPT